MESMRSLNSSLPRSSPHARRKQANSELLQAFKTAALSVTQLYKTATVEEEDVNREVRNAGYIDALDDLLAFLDHRNLGLGDGEGWQVREWATQRHQSLNINSRTSEESRMTEEGEQRGRSTSPPTQHKSPPQYQPASVQTDSPSSAPLNEFPTPRRSPPQQTPPPEVFHFRSPIGLPQQQDANMATVSQRSPPSVRLELLPRTSRHNSCRSGYHTRVADRAQALSQGSLGHGAGSKRRAPLHEFFELTGANGTRDGPASGKRGRFV